MKLAAARVVAAAVQHRGTEFTETHRASGLARRPAAVVAVETRSAAARRAGSRASRVHGSPLALTALRAVPGLDVLTVLVFSVCPVCRDCESPGRCRQRTAGPAPRLRGVGCEEIRIRETSRAFSSFHGSGSLHTQAPAEGRAGPVAVQ